MADIYDVAKAILEHFPHGVSTMKLNRLTYFAQGWSLALTGKPLFQEDFEAWAWGPVSPLLQAHLRTCTEEGYSISSDVFGRGCPENLTDTERAIIDAAVDDYGALTGMQLSDITIQEGSPWHKIRQEHGVREADRSNVIVPKGYMLVHFCNVFANAKRPGKRR